MSGARCFPSAVAGGFAPDARPPRGTWQRFLLVLAALILAVETPGAGAAPPSRSQPRDLFDLGYAHQTGEGAIRDLEQALVLYQQALKLDPELVPALFNSGLIYFEQKEYARAEAFFIKTAHAARKVRVGAADYEALARNGLGSCYQKKGAKAEAETQFRVALRLNPQLVEAYYNLANLMVEQKRLSEAEQVLAIAERQAPSAQYQVLRGRIGGKKGREGPAATGGKIGIAVLVGALLIYALFIRLRRRRRA